MGEKGVVNACLIMIFTRHVNLDIENHFRENTDFQFVFKNAYAEKILLKDNVPIQTEPKIEKVKEKGTTTTILVLFILVLFSSGLYNCCFRVFQHVFIGLWFRS